MFKTWIRSLFKDGPTARDTIATVGGVYSLIVLIYAAYLAVTRL